MTRLKMLGAAALLSATAFAAPAMAQQVIDNPGYCAQFYPNANCQNIGPNNPYTGDYQRRQAARRYHTSGYNGRTDRGWNNTGWNNNGWKNNNGWNDRGWNQSWNDNRSGFWPGDVAADVVGGAVGTAGAIATAPFRAGDSYAWNNGYNGNGYNGGWSNQSYAKRNGFVCTPGTYFRGEDGRRHICQ
jgi:hypothetical protein